MDTSEEATPILGGKKSEPVVAPAPSAEPVTNAAPVAAEPKKKSHAGLIITIIILAVLLIGAGVFFLFFFVLRGGASTSVNDAISNLLKSENVNFSTSFETEGEAKGSVSLKASKAGSKVGIEANAKATGDIDVKFNAVAGDGKAYIKLDGVDSTNEIGFVYGLIGGMSGQELDANSMMSMLMFMGPVFKQLNGNWYKIDGSETAMMGEGDNCSKIYTSLLSDDGMKTIDELYKANPFFIPKEGAEVKNENGNKKVIVVVDKEKSKAFREALEKKENLGFSATCKLPESSDKEPSGEAVFTIDGSNKLVGLSFTNESVKKTYDIKVDYEKTEIEVPSNAKSFTELFSSIFGGLGGLLGGDQPKLDNPFGGDDSDDDDSDDDDGGLGGLLELLGGGDDDDDSDSGDDSSIKDLLKLLQN